MTLIQHALSSVQNAWTLVKEMALGLAGFFLLCLFLKMSSTLLPWKEKPFQSDSLGLNPRDSPGGLL